MACVWFGRFILRWLSHTSLITWAPSPSVQPGLLPLEVWSDGPEDGSHLLSTCCGPVLSHNLISTSPFNLLNNLRSRYTFIDEESEAQIG